MPIRTVTCFIVQSGRVLLQKRPVGKTWAGMLNGPGGKINFGEEAPDAIFREVLEETGLRVINAEPRGSLALQIPLPQLVDFTVDIFVANTFQGGACEREGSLSWYHRDALPFDHMWADQRYWLLAVLDGFSVDGMIAYEPDSLRLSQCQLRLRLLAADRRWRVGRPCEPVATNDSASLQVGKPRDGTLGRLGE
jgi:8-oxo-dGTP diphosphatase